MKKVLTIIMPFLNEKYEVENTLQSIREHSTDEIDIILINDSSNDGFDYKSIAKEYGAIYIENFERLGVAASRDLGVERCQTEYFLFLDAHMRFYNKLWISRIIEELNMDKRALLCCQTKVLKLEDGLLVERTDKGPSYGAYVELRTKMDMIEPVWLLNLPFEHRNLQTVPIICVLGAGYACNKAYWKYLKGLDGLMYYGTDESYISMKVWMEGGSCKLLKDVVIGHIYRKFKPPYETDLKYRLFNRLYIAELLLPDTLNKKLRQTFKLYHFSVLAESLYMLHDKRNKITGLKQYYQQIFTRNFDFFDEMNKKYYPIVKNYKLLENTNDILNRIALRIGEQVSPDIGIIKGRMGVAIFMFHLAQFLSDEIYKKQAEQLLNSLLP